MRYGRCGNENVFDDRREEFILIRQKKSSVVFPKKVQSLDFLFLFDQATKRSDLLDSYKNKTIYPKKEINK